VPPSMPYPYAAPAAPGTPPSTAYYAAAVSPPPTGVAYAPLPYGYVPVPPPGSPYAAPAYVQPAGSLAAKPAVSPAPGAATKGTGSGVAAGGGSFDFVGEDDKFNFVAEAMQSGQLA